LAAYQPAVPVTIEGFGWAIAGLALGYLAVSALIGFITLPFRWRNGRVPRRQMLPRRRRAGELVVETVTLDEIDRRRSRT
jgi:hypothetical protein